MEMVYVESMDGVGMDFVVYGKSSGSPFLGKVICNRDSGFYNPVSPI